jgi:hypothetical protein
LSPSISGCDQSLAWTLSFPFPSIAGHNCDFNKFFHILFAKSPLLINSHWEFPEFSLNSCLTNPERAETAALSPRSLPLTPLMAYGPNGQWPTGLFDLLSTRPLGSLLVPRTCMDSGSSGCRANAKAPSLSIAWCTTHKMCGNIAKYAVFLEWVEPRSCSLSELKLYRILKFCPQANRYCSSRTFQSKWSTLWCLRALQTRAWSSCFFSHRIEVIPS